MASCDNSTGECECRNNVFGRVCGECMDGYWNLDQANPDGCQGKSEECLFKYYCHQMNEFINK